VQEVFSLMPKSIAATLNDLSPSIQEMMEEIRIRVLRPLEIIADGKPLFHPYIITEDDVVYLLNRLSQFSIYTMEEELKRGYITIQGGHRVGLAGKVITENGKVKVIRDVTSFNFRIAKERIGIADSLLPFLYQYRWKNTVIIGSPQTGKTTMLRDLARIISEGHEKRGIPSKKVGIVDERSEIAGCVKGIPQFSFGPRVDVLDACPKAEGMMMMIRSMSPDVLIADEIGRMEDSDAIMEAVNAGVQLMITVHGETYEDLWKRPSLRKMLEIGAFERFVELSRIKGPGTVKRILNHQGEDLFRRMGVTKA
jgi:stage III sporulation protein AA